MPFRNAVLLLATLCVGCSPSDLGSMWTGSVSDSAGVTIVSNSNEPIWNGADRWTVERNLVIGAVDGDSNYLFGNITGICVATDRRIYVLDQAATVKVRMYAPDGVFLDAFGQAGNGPGEMGDRVGPCLMAPGDTLHIPDQRNFRVNRYAADGSSVGNVRFDVREGFPVGWDVFDADGRFLGEVTMPARFMAMKFVGEEIYGGVEGRVGGGVCDAPQGSDTGVRERRVWASRVSISAIEGIQGRERTVPVRRCTRGTIPLHGGSMRISPLARPVPSMTSAASLLAFVGIGCVGGDAELPVAITRDSAGVEIVESIRPAWDETRAWRISAEPVVQIGVEAGAEEYQFANVRSALRLDNSTIVVMNGGSAELRYYDDSGRYSNG